MLPHFFNQTVIRLRAGEKDSRGTTIPDWNNPTSIEISNCHVQPSASDVDFDGRVLGLKNMYRVYCDIDSDVKAGDRIIFDGVTFTVDEEPRKWRSPSGAVSNLQFSMTDWEG